MPSSATASNRLQKPGAGEQVNVWGTSALNGDFDLIDTALDGWAEIAVAGNVTLTSVNYAADQARNRALHFTGAGGFTVTSPGVSKTYICANDCTADVTFSNGTSGVTVYAGETVHIVTDGAANFRRVEPRHFGGAITVAGGVTVAGAISGVTDPTLAQQAATKAYVDSQTLAATLVSFPARPGNARRGLRVTADESAVEWAGPLDQRAATGTTSVSTADRGKLLVCSGTFTVTLGGAAGLGADFACYIQNAGTGAVTLAAPGGTTVDGLASYIMYPGEVRLVLCNATLFTTIVLAAFYKVWTSTDSGFVWPPGYGAFTGLGWGAGGGGGNGTAASNGGSGGGGAACMTYNIAASTVTSGATATITVAAASTAHSNGGTSSIAALATFYGGGAGQNASGTGGGGGGALSSASGVTAGGPAASSAGNDNGGFGGAASTGAGAGQNAVYGGASGGAGDTNNTPGGAAIFGGGGGGGGMVSGGSSGGAGGASRHGGAGGGGGTAGVGAAGTAPGGGGGGGSSTGSSAGGAGARGEVRMWGIV